MKKDEATITKAAHMAGEWWAKRLHPDHQGKADQFFGFVSMAVYDHLSKTDKPCFLEVDYDPRGILLDAVKAIIEPECSGVFFSARGILPAKHSLAVTAERLEPKEGYGNWTDHIIVNSMEDSNNG